MAARCDQLTSATVPQCGVGEVKNLISEEAGLPVLEGYITATHMPSGFDINECHVIVAPQTGVGYVGDRLIRTQPLRSKLRPGSFVAVMGVLDKKTRTATAQTVFIRNDSNKSISGKGIVLKVDSPGQNPVFHADGYAIRLSPSAVAKGVKDLSTAGPGVFMRYTGKLAPDGILVASKARFDCKANQPNPTAKPFSEADLQPWKVVPQDDPLSRRVARIANNLMSAYVRNGVRSDASGSIRVFLVDNKLHDGYAIREKDVVLISKHSAELLQNDSQLAALVAEGMAGALQVRDWLSTDAQAAGVAAALTGMGFAALANPLFALGPLGIADRLAARGSLGPQDPETLEEENRDRIALSLMAEAGYDLYQAPEAWRLLFADGHPAQDPATLPYTFRGGHEFNLMLAQYPEYKSPAASAGHEPRP